MGKKNKARSANGKDNLAAQKKISPLKRNELNNIADKLLKREFLFKPLNY